MVRNLLLMSVVLCGLAATPVHGQVARPEVTPQLALARIRVSEVGYRDPTDSPDDPAIYESIRNSARIRSLVLGREMTWLERAMEHSHRTFDVARRDLRSYVVFLMPDGSEPAHWPRMVSHCEGPVTGHRVCTDRPHISWARRRDSWMAIYARAGRIVSGREHAQCVEPPTTWGCPPERVPEGRTSCNDHEDAMDDGNLVRVDCGATRNWFYRPLSDAEQESIERCEVRMDRATGYLVWLSDGERQSCLEAQNGVEVDYE